MIFCQIPWKAARFWHLHLLMAPTRFFMLMVLLRRYRDLRFPILSFVSAPLLCSFSVNCFRICISSMPCDGSSRMAQAACGTGSIKASCIMRLALSELCCLFQIDRTTMCSTLYEIDEPEAEHALSLKNYHKEGTRDLITSTGVYLRS